MTTTSTFADLSVGQLKRAVQLKEQIDGLQSQLEGILRGREWSTPRAMARRITPQGRARIVAAQRQRWAKIRAAAKNAISSSRSTAARRALSPSARARISAAAKARWAKFRSQRHSTGQ